MSNHAGRKICEFDSWEEHQSQIDGYAKAKYKQFDNEDNEDFVNNYSNAGTSQNVHKGNANDISSEMVKNLIMNKINSIEQKFTEINSKLDLIIENINTKRAATVDDQVTKKKLKLEPLIQGDVIINENDSVVVYTDGSCTNNGKTGAKAGIGVWFNYDHNLNVSAPVKGSPTNNFAEIQAARIAIEQAKKAKIRKLNIHTDSEYLINCITQWIHKWKKNNWTLLGGGVVKNKEELIKLDNAIKNVEVVEWTYVHGHKRIAGNQMADKLAKLGAEAYQSNLTFGKDSQEFDQ